MINPLTNRYVRRGNYKRGDDGTVGSIALVSTELSSQLVHRFIQFLQSHRHSFVVVQLKPQPPTFTADVHERAQYSYEPSKCLIHAVI
jgi:hypothetical protein